MQEEKKPKKPQSLTLENRKTLIITGVSDVADFDAAHVSAATDYGMLTVKGSGLKIGRMSVESGELSIDGRIDAVFYEDDGEKKGFFARLLK